MTGHRSTVTGKSCACAATACSTATLSKSSSVPRSGDGWVRSAASSVTGIADELHAHLEPEVDDALDHRLGARLGRLQLQLHVVRPDKGLPEAVHGPDEAHHELVRRLLVELARR